MRCKPSCVYDKDIVRTKWWDERRPKKGRVLIKCAQEKETRRGGAGEIGGVEGEEETKIMRRQRDGKGKVVEEGSFTSEGKAEDQNFRGGCWGGERKSRRWECGTAPLCSGYVDWQLQPDCVHWLAEWLAGRLAAWMQQRPHSFALVSTSLPVSVSQQCTKLVWMRENTYDSTFFFSSLPFQK